jgi:hypothetical protein
VIAGSPPLPPPPPGLVSRAASARALTLAGRTGEGRRVVLRIRRGAVVAARVGVVRYRCGRFGDVGPVVVSVGGRARLDRAGRFHLRAGAAVQRLALDGRVGRSGHAATGSLRLTGMIATGQPCRSRRIAFRAAVRR